MGILSVNNCQIIKAKYLVITVGLLTIFLILYYIITTNQINI